MKRFLDAASKDAEVMKKLDRVKDPSEFIAIANEMGFTLTAKDLKEGTPKKGELEDDDLEHVAGGRIDFVFGLGFVGKGSFGDGADPGLC